VKAAEAIFVDTWGWLAYGHRRDAHHAEVKELVAACVSNRSAVVVTEDNHFLHVGMGFERRP
jgi:predicted nucleic acid-binding protein